MTTASSQASQPVQAPLRPMPQSSVQPAPIALAEQAALSPEAQMTRQPEPEAQQAAADPQPPTAQRQANRGFDTSRTAKSPENPDYTVEDLNATRYNKTKTHQLPVKQPNGKIQLKAFKFEPGQKTKMSQELALRFLSVDPSFRVENSRGQVVRPANAVERGARTVTLKPHELVVPVTAVLKDYLLQLARSLPGGEDMFGAHPSDSNRTDIEEFVIAGGKATDGDEDTYIDTTAE